MFPRRKTHRVVVIRHIAERVLAVSLRGWQVRWLLEAYAKALVMKLAVLLKTGGRGAVMKKPKWWFSVWLKFRLIEVAGWMLVASGVAAVVLPGPGLLLIAGGLALLAMRYEWAKKLLRPIKRRALHLARQSVQTWPRITFSLLLSGLLVGVGIFWGVGLPVPGWWPVDTHWWLFGGWGTGVTLLASETIALGTVVYSFRHFRRHALPESHDGAN